MRGTRSCLAVLSRLTRGRGGGGGGEIYLLEVGCEVKFVARAHVLGEDAVLEKQSAGHLGD